MRQLKNISYFNIYENVVLYLLKFTVTYQFKNFSHSLSFLYGGPQVSRQN